MLVNNCTVHKKHFSCIWSHCAIFFFTKASFFTLVPLCNCTPTKDTFYEFGATVQLLTNIGIFIYLVLLCNLSMKLVPLCNCPPTQGIFMHLVPLCNEKNLNFYKRHFFNLVPQCNCTPAKDTFSEVGPLCNCSPT